MTFDPCLLKGHYEKQIVQEMLAILGIRNHYDIVQCATCKRWYVVRRPDWGDAA